MCDIGFIKADSDTIPSLNIIFMITDFFKNDIRFNSTEVNLSVKYQLFLTQCGGRKYDVEYEARKIYGQDLKSVLDRFRKTQDYIQILNSELEKLHKKITVNIAQHQNFYTKKLKEMVNQIIADNSTNGALRRRSTSGDYYTKYIGPHRKPIVRQHTHNMSGIERLEQYNKLYPALTLKSRNAMVELGFEYCGHAIHGVINSISPDSASMSTLLPFDASGKVPLTHDAHKVTKFKTTENEETTNADFNRNFKKDTRQNKIE